MRSRATARQMMLRWLNRALGTDRLEELIGSRDGFNGQSNTRATERALTGIRCRSSWAVPNAGTSVRLWLASTICWCSDETTATDKDGPQVRFLLGWLRSTVPHQRCGKR